MERFTKEITVNNEKKLFEFSKMKDMSGVKFFITSKDMNQKPIAFSLIESSQGKWKLRPGALRWLYDIEVELSDAIRDTQLK